MTIARLKAILNSIVTWLTIVQFVLVVLAEEIAQLLADGDTATVIQWIVRIGALVTTVIAIIRRVTPVLPEQQGLVLPPGAPTKLRLQANKRPEADL